MERGLRSTMMSRRSALKLAGGSILAALPAAATTRAAVKPIVPSRGINLPGWFDRNDGVAPSEAVLEKLRGSGFQTIRLPINGDLLSTGDTSALHRIEAGVIDLNRLGFSVLLDMHPSESLHTALRQDFEAGSRRVAEAWTALGVVVANLPSESVYPELLNEPPMGSDAWLQLRDRLAEIVRSKCPNHTLIWGPSPSQGIWEIGETPPLADDNQIAAIHFYSPTAFTHQCETWDASPLARISNLPFPATIETPLVQESIDTLRADGDEQAASLIEEQLTTPWTEEAIASEFVRLRRWSETHDCPVMMNEFGVLNFCVDAESRRFWVRAVRQAAEANQVGWAYWELDQGFGIIQSRRSIEGFDNAMIAALMDGPDGG
ncbi:MULTISPECIES: cellulase family glycosylhydrolase [unclassified Rhizobium]|uniref:glycoside hydrolase family 5 protein n=1 Tax=unclassified Rhizobium TaxID=2613769 RepID=UPI000645EB97|nr:MULTISPECIES: cellulase family glycosylhydrolase [unclassified Rhizobium]MBN8950574.1 cellulase family glycosylhydrolase [Rhizobium tropici]OJY66128.1 MAG: endoglucanase [Rhizobium sp. 60-20]RKD69328.1 endoglucanase [Rhizobium sp. WW_1]